MAISDVTQFDRRHAVGCFVCGAIDLVVVSIVGGIFGFSVIDILLLKVDAAALFVIVGYLLLVAGVYLLFKGQPEPSSVDKRPGSN